jgi:hypothetical protein
MNTDINPMNARNLKALWKKIDMPRCVNIKKDIKIIESPYRGGMII